jgi:ABC-type Fe3+/spermidine/putrescine transport system ATPase subunit
MTAFLKVQHLLKKFGRVLAVDGVEFDVGEGEVLTLLGPSGCGKTTTLRMIAGFELPDQGEVSVGGRTIVSTLRRICLAPEKRDMGMVFQSYAVWPHMTVAENVAYPLKLRHMRSSEIRKRVGEVLELVGLSGLERRSSMLLSGGQQQRVALARALVYSPKILLLDEPLSNLDAKLREQMRFELKAIQQRLGMTVIFVTHDQVEAMTLSDRLAVMNQGRIEQFGTPEEIYEHPRTRFVQEFIGRVIWFEGSVVDTTPRDIWVTLSGNGGTRIQCERNGAEFHSGDPVVLAVRPDELGVGRAEKNQDTNSVPCCVEASVFLGESFECHLRYGPHAFTIATSRLQPFSPGEMVTLQLPPKSVNVWHKSDAVTLAST